MSDASGFSTVELGSLFEAVNGGGTPSRNNPDYWSGNIPWASVKDFSDNQFTLEQTEEHITDLGLQNSTSKLIPESIPVICLRMAVGRSALTVRPISINQDLKALFPRKDVDSKYVVYLLQQFRNVIEAKAIGSTVKGVSTKELLRTSIPFPNTIKTQQKIAKILTTIDQLIEKTQALIDKHTAIKQGMMADLFTRGIDPTTGQLRPPVEQAPHLYKETELGWIPKEWEYGLMGEVCRRNGGSVQTGPFGSQLHAEDYQEEGTPIITVEHLGDNQILHTNLPLVGQNDFLRLIKYSLREGDLVFSRVGAIDRCAFVSKSEDGWLFSGRCLRVRTGRSEISSRFLSYLLNTDPSRQWILNHSVGSTMACLNTSILSNVPIVIPSRAEQNIIACRFDSISKKQIDELNSLEKLKLIKNGVMQDLLTGNVEVKGN